MCGGALELTRHWSDAVSPTSTEEFPLPTTVGSFSKSRDGTSTFSVKFRLADPMRFLARQVYRAESTFIRLRSFSVDLPLRYLMPSASKGRPSLYQNISGRGFPVASQLTLKASPDCLV